MPKQQRTHKGRKANARKGRPKRKTGGRYGSLAAYNLPASKPREANLMLTNEELWATVTGDGGTSVIPLTFLPGSSGLSILDAEAKRFDLYRIRKCELEWRPSCAVTTAGRIVVAIDYDSYRVPTTYQGLYPIQPQMRPQVFAGGRVGVDPTRANKQMWLRTDNGANIQTSAFVAMVACTAAAAAGAVGEIFCRYTVEMTNPRETTTFVSTMYGADDAETIVSYKSADDMPFKIQGRTVGSGNVVMNFRFWRPGYYMIQEAGYQAVADVQAAISTIQNWVTGLQGAGNSVKFLYDTAVQSTNSLQFLLKIGQAAFNSYGEGNFVQTPDLPPLPNDKLSAQIVALTDGNTFDQNPAQTEKLPRLQESDVQLLRKQLRDLHVLPREGDDSDGALSSRCSSIVELPPAKGKRK